MFVLDTHGRTTFLNPQELRSAYVELPDPSVLDSVAPAWLTEVRRFSLSARSASHVLESICGENAAMKTGFEGDIQNAVRAWFRGEKLGDGAALGGAVRHVGRAFEDLIGGVYDTLFSADGRLPKDLNDMIGLICHRLNDVAHDYEPQLLEDVAQLLRRLRNKATHEQASPNFGKIRARLSTELLLATSEYFKILHAKGLLRGNIRSFAKGSSRCAIEGQPGQKYFLAWMAMTRGGSLNAFFKQD